MRGGYLRKLREYAQRCGSFWRTRGLVLLYHRVQEAGADPWALAVTPENFATHLEILRRSCSPVTLTQLRHAATTGTIARGSVAFTFDDGYADNLHVAKPLLARFDVPATIFVSSGVLDDPTVLWWDVLQRLILQPGRLPAELTIETGSQARTWTLGPAVDFSVADAVRFRAWRGIEKAPCPRIVLYLELWELLRTLSAADRRAALEQLSAWSGRSLAPPAADRPLMPEEVATLADDPLVEIGAHTVNHARLSSLSAAMQLREIRESKAQLEEVIAAPVSAFAYPHGSHNDYTPETVGLVRMSGFQCACSAVYAAVDRRTDPYQIPRIYVENWDGDEFARVVSRWLGLRIP